MFRKEQEGLSVGMFSIICELGISWLSSIADVISATYFQIGVSGTADQHSTSGGAVYIRWGRKTCPGNGTDLLYWGKYFKAVNWHFGWLLQRHVELTKTITNKKSLCLYINNYVNIFFLLCLSLPSLSVQLSLRKASHPKRCFSNGQIYQVAMVKCFGQS